jgi:hypothetical protein
MSIIQVTDFANGKFIIPTNPMQTTDLQTYIDDAQRSFLVQLLGVELYDLFIADLVNNVPQSARFIKIFNPFNDQTNDVLTISDGMKEMLKGFVYYLYLRDLVNRATTTGLTKSLPENADNVSGVWYDLNRRYNESVETYKVIQNYMVVVDPTNYKEYEGVNLDYNHNF